MIETIAFVFTAFIVILNLMVWIAAVGGNGYTVPSYKLWLDPTNFIFYYPSLIYQIWFWSNYLNIL